MRLTFAVLTLGAISGLAAGEERGREVSYEVSPHAKYVLPADLRTGSGSTSVFRGGLDVSTNIPIGTKAGLGFEITSEYSHYRFKNTTAFGAGAKPVSNTQEYELRASYRRTLDEHWGIFTAVGINYAGENGADFNKSLTYGGVVGGTYKFSDSLNIGLGILARTRLEDNAWVLPLPLITWKIDDRWTFTTERKNATLTFKAQEDWKIFLSADGDVHEYRTDTSSAASKGTFRDSAILVSVGTTYSIHKNVSLTAGAGANVYRELRLDDKDGNRIAKSKTDPAAVFFVSASVRF
jgi:hypothetical protein